MQTLYAGAAFAAILATHPAPAPASDPDGRARAALALAAASGPCGSCRTDLQGARDEAAKSGKPLVIFVATDCGGLARDRPDAVAVRVPSYDRDGRPATEPRAVVVASVAGSLQLRETVAPLAGRAGLDRAIRSAGGKPAPLDWFAGD